MDYFVTNNSLAPAPMGIQSTAGAVPIRNDKGQVSMKKVKVHRYVSGKRPDYAPAASTDEESEDDDFIDRQSGKPSTGVHADDGDDEAVGERMEVDTYEDPRLRRLTRLERQRGREGHSHVDEDDDENEDDGARNVEIRVERHRRVHQPEILEAPAEQSERSRERIKLESSDSSEEEDLSDSEIERRREALKARVLLKKDVQEEQVIQKDEEEKMSSSEESSEYEEYTDSEEETGPRLKPVFVRKRDRITVMEKEKEAIKQKQAEAESKKLADERKKQSLKVIILLFIFVSIILIYFFFFYFIFNSFINDVFFQMVEDSIRKDTTTIKSNDANTIEAKLDDVCTSDENDEVEYEAWKLREMKRIKRDREEREA